MKNRKLLPVLLIAVTVFALLAGCQQAEPEEPAEPAEVEEQEPIEEEAEEAEPVAEVEEPATMEPIYFAWYGPLTGDAKQYGDTEKVAVELALEKINGEMGGVLGGREIVVDFFDDKNDASETVIIANKIIGDGKFTAAIGGFSSTCTMAAAPLFEEAKMVNYSPTASHADYSGMGEHLFRNTPTQAIETTAYAEYVYNEMGIRTIALLNVNDDWGNNISSIFTNKFEELGGEVLVSENYIPNQTTDFTPMIAKAKEADPEAFFPIGYYADSANILKQADGLDFDVQMVLSSSTLKQELIDLAGDLANGAFLMNAFSPDIATDRFQEVMAKYEERTGKKGDAFVMQTYDVVMQLATAIEEAGTTDNVILRDTLANMEDYECLAGTYSMNELGDAVRPLQPIQVIDGEFVNLNAQ